MSAFDALMQIIGLIFDLTPMMLMIMILVTVFTFLGMIGHMGNTFDRGEPDNRGFNFK
jgi:hypothetical protein